MRTRRKFAKVFIRRPGPATVLTAGLLRRPGSARAPELDFAYQDRSKTHAEVLRQGGTVVGAVNFSRRRARLRLGLRARDQRTLQGISLESVDQIPDGMSYDQVTQIIMIQARLVIKI